MKYVLITTVHIKQNKTAGFQQLKCHMWVVEGDQRKGKHDTVFFSYQKINICVIYMIITRTRRKALIPAPYLGDH